MAGQDALRRQEEDFLHAHAASRVELQHSVRAVKEQYAVEVRAPPRPQAVAQATRRQIWGSRPPVSPSPSYSLRTRGSRPEMPTVPPCTVG